MRRTSNLSKHSLLIALMFFFFVFSAVHGQQSKDSFIKEYKIGPRDVLEIKVFELPELNQIVRVSEGGSISLALLGKVVVGGLSKDSIEKKIAELLEEQYLKNAKVSVFITEYQSNQVSVIGAVVKPGIYDLMGRTTLLKLISQAGGFTEKASDEIFILREGKNGVPTKFSIDLKELLEEGNQMLNIPLEKNDIINIPAEKSVFIYIYGAVNKPGALSVIQSKNITLLQLVAQAGGLAEGASKKGVVITRKNKTGKAIKIKVNLKDIEKGKIQDIELQEGDLIHVPESIW